MGKYALRHAVSKDLIHWVQLPIALYPDENGVCFSGGTLIDKNNSSGFGKNAMIALYTSVAKEQTQSLAYSLDNGRSCPDIVKIPSSLVEVRKLGVLR